MRRRPRITYREIALIAFFALGIGWFSYLTWGILRKEELARQDVNDTKAQLAALEARNATLEGNIADLDTERGKEAVLRDTEGVAKPGENVIIVVPPASSTNATSSAPWWQRVFSWF